MVKQTTKTKRQRQKKETVMAVEKLVVERNEIALEFPPT